MQILLRMIQKYIFQIALILIIISISILFYFNFLYQKKTTNSQSTFLLEEDKSEIQEDVSSNLINIEYNSYDEDGNSFYLNAESATIKIQETDLNEQNKVNLKGVVGVISLKEKGVVYIYAKNAIYNKITNDTYFFNDVKMEYINNKILSQNIDLVFSNKKAEIYNEVFIENKKFKLNTDKILLDMVTGDIKLEMIEDEKKVKLITNYEFIN
tara:strand:+ start:6954 stop:7589 length:636 start_codon:yes stop_codon:yes gene_type:complete